MKQVEILGLIIKQAREGRGWTQKELADKAEISEEDVSLHEKGQGDLDALTTAAYYFLLNISPNITAYEGDVEDALKMDRMYRELQSLSEEQFHRLIDSAEHKRSWNKSHPDVVTLKDYWETFE